MGSMIQSGGHILTSTPQDLTPDFLTRPPAGYRDAFFQYVYQATFQIPPTGTQVLEADPLQIEYDADFICYSVSAVTTADNIGAGTMGPDVLVRFTNAAQRYLQNIPSRLTYLCGSGANPRSLMPPVLYPRGSAALFDVSNNTVNNAQPQGGIVQVTLNGVKRFADTSMCKPVEELLRQGVPRPKEYVFKVTLKPLQLIDDMFITVDKDADFIWRSLKIDVQPTPAPNVVPMYRFSDDTGYRFQNIRKLNDLPLSGGTAGCGMMPGVIWPEHVIPAGGRINIELQEVLNFNAGTVTLVFGGEKIYPIRTGRGWGG